jgi:hypothetical protein
MDSATIVGTPRPGAGRARPLPGCWGRTNVDRQPDQKPAGPASGGIRIRALLLLFHSHSHATVYTREKGLAHTIQRNLKLTIEPKGSTTPHPHSPTQSEWLGDERHPYELPRYQFARAHARGISRWHPANSRATTDSTNEKNQYREDSPYATPSAERTWTSPAAPLRVQAYH